MKKLELVRSGYVFKKTMAGFAIGLYVGEQEREKLRMTPGFLTLAKFVSTG